MKTITRGLLTFAAACLAVPAFAQTVAREYSLEIERQPLAAALTEFSKQTGLQIGYFPETLTENILIGPLIGRYTAEAAITQLLVPIGLSFERLNERTITVTGPESTRSRRRGFSTIEQKTDHRTVPSFVRLTNMRLAEGPATEEDNQQIRTAANARESDDKKRLRGALEEVIVTAQKREERLQDVPISVSVLSGTYLERSTAEGTTELLNRVPGVSTAVGNLSNGTIVVMRGVSGGLVFGGSSTAGYYLDSVPFGFVRHGFVPDTNAYDMERIEVLRGPQGTLYGASAQIGVIRIMTKDANPDALEFKARTSVSATEKGAENYRGDMAVNVPIIDGKLAARAVLGYQDLSGWIDLPNRKDTNDAELRNMRFKINAQPTDQLSIGVSAWLSRSDYGAPSISDEGGRRNLPTQFDEQVAADYDVYGLKIGYDFPGFSLASTTSYLEYESGNNLDFVALGAPGLYLFTGLETEMFSQEVILNSTHGGSWRWTAGGMFRDGDDRLFQDIPPGIFTIDFGQTSKSIAVFGELTRLFAEGRFELTAGLRYFEDDVGDTENALTTGASGPLIRRNDTFDAVSPRVVLTWHPSAQLTVYGSYAEGFRSGFNQWALVTRSAPEFPAVKPDTIKNYEVGAKGSLWNGRITFDTAFYYIDWLDKIEGLTIDFNGIDVSAFINGDSASGIGVDFGVTTQIFEGFELDVSVGWNDLRMDDDVFTQMDGNSTLLFSKGDRLNSSPEYTAGMSAEYVFPLGNSGFIGRFTASANYASKFEGRGFLFGALRKADGDSMLIGRTGFSIDTPNRWTATLFVDNVSNEDNAVMRDPRVIPDWSIRIRPRTIGLQFEYHY